MHKLLRTIHSIITYLYIISLISIITLISNHNLKMLSFFNCLKICDMAIKLLNKNYYVMCAVMRTLSSACLISSFKTFPLSLIIFGNVPE